MCAEYPGRSGWRGGRALAPSRCCPSPCGGSSGERQQVTSPSEAYYWRGVVNRLRVRVWGTQKVRERSATHGTHPQPALRPHAIATRTSLSVYRSRAPWFRYRLRALWLQVTSPLHCMGFGRSRCCPSPCGGSSARFRGGLVFKAHRLLHHSTQGLRVIIIGGVRHRVVDRLCVRVWAVLNGWGACPACPLGGRGEREVRLGSTRRPTGLRQQA